MNSKFWQHIKAEWNLWRQGAWPGLGMIGLISAVRLVGYLQGPELVALDTCLRLRPAEPRDARIVLVTFTERDLQQLGTLPSRISDRQLISLLQKLQSYQPALIGLDLFRDQPYEPGHAELNAFFRQTKNLIGIDQALPHRGDATVPPPPALPPDQVGFADLKLDADGYFRRSLLGVHAPSGEYRYAFSLRLAEEYLALQGLVLDNGIRDPEAMRFGETELPRVQPNFGGYVRADAGGNQILLSFRSGRSPFQVFSVSQILAGTLQPAALHGRIVIVGVTAISGRDFLPSRAISGANSSLISGVELHAHATSQVLSAVLDKRPLLNSWAEGWEYLWIVTWGLVSIGLGRWLRSLWHSALGLLLAGSMLSGVSYGLLLLGWWVPLVPAALLLVLNGLGLPAALFYRYEVLRSQIEARQLVIDQLFSAIHNQPLQTLANLRRKAAEENERFLADLNQLNQELRAVYDTAQRELGSGSQAPNLQAPLYELLYEVYHATLARDFPGFQTLRVKIVQFDPLPTRLTPETKQALCRFLEEALCNVGKHAISPTRLSVTYTQERAWLVIRVEDNGKGSVKTGHENPREGKNQQPKPQNSGFGTRQAENLAKQLGGRFQRFSKQPCGVVCELNWPARRFWFQQF